MNGLALLADNNIIALLSGVMVAWWITGVKGQHVDYLGYTDFEVKVVNLIEFLWFVVITVLLFKREKSKNMVQGVEMQA